MLVVSVLPHSGQRVSVPSEGWSADSHSSFPPSVSKPQPRHFVRVGSVVSSTMGDRCTQSDKCVSRVGVIPVHASEFGTGPVLDPVPLERANPADPLAEFRSPTTTRSATAGSAGRCRRPTRTA